MLSGSQLVLMLSLGFAFFANLALSKETQVISYHKEIKPIFQANCNGCHQPAKQKGDYLMTEFVAMLEGGEARKGEEREERGVGEARVAWS